MKRSRLYAVPCLLVALTPPGTVAWAQTSSVVAENQEAAQTPYVDREITSLSPEPTGEVAESVYDRTGWPRFLRLETRLGTQPFDSVREARLGYGIYALIETPNHGTLSVDGNHTPRNGGGALTVRQRGMPMSSGWLMSNEVGVISTPAPETLRLPARLYLPSAIVQGISTEWSHAERGLQWQATTGEPGRLTLLPVGGFRRLPGQRTAMGGQWHLNALAKDPASRQGWTFALQHEEARDVSALDDPSLTGDRVNARSTLLALRHEGAEHRIQGQVLQTQASHLNGSRGGAWVDAEWSDGPRRHGAGAYRLEQDLNWAQMPVANDLVGAYVRSSWRTRQWSAEGSADWLDSLSGRTGSGFFATGAARWRLNREHSLGAGTTVRRFGGNAWNAYGDWRFLNGWGTTGLRLDVTQGDAEATTRRLAWDQEWPVEQGWALSTTLAAGAVAGHQGRPAEDVWNAALSVSAPVGSRASLRGNLNAERSGGGMARHSLNLAGSWRMAPRWSMEAHLNRSTGRGSLVASLDPLAPPPAYLSTASDRSYYVVLRYELDGGSRTVPLGGRAAEGGGRIEGTVYFDGNRSGTQDASEQGVPNATVYLDNRYAVRTDAQGRFEFPFVAAGPRTVTVRNETLPLPWAVVDDGQVRLDVRRRETTKLNVPIQRND